MASSVSPSSSRAREDAGILQVFQPFKHFPPEIRLIIWTLATAEPRVVEVGFYETKVKGRKVTRNTSKTVVPALLHTCSESREVGLAQYEKFIPTGIFTGTYINWTQDYIYMDCSHGQFLDFRLYQTRLQELSQAQKDGLPQKCRRLLLGGRLYAPIDSLMVLFEVFEEVAVLHQAEPYDEYYSHQTQNEILGTVGGEIALAEVNYDEIKLETAAPNSGSYHALWSYVDKHRKRWKTVSLVKATRTSHRPLSRQEKAIGRERERQEKLDDMAPVKPTKIIFKNWRVQELVFEAKARGLDSEGTKSDMVARLQENEQIPYYHALEEYEEALDQYRKTKESKGAVPSQV